MVNESKWSQIKFVTSNLNKVQEASKILEFPLEQVSTIIINEIQTHDINEIVEDKVKQAYKKLKCPVMVEDSGLVFSAWNGLPGALVKWFEISVGCHGLLKMLEGFNSREAFAICVIAIFDGQNICFSKGEVKGKLAYSVRGTNGFGWDTIFIPDGYEKTYAEMSFDEKNFISHRCRAFENLKITYGL